MVPINVVAYIQVGATRKMTKTYIKFLFFDLYLLTFLGLCVNAIFDYRFLARFIPLVMIVVFMVGMVVSVVGDRKTIDNQNNP